MMNQEKLLESLLADYRRLFDVYSPHDLCGRRTLAYCYFTSRNERYVLIKRAVIWAAESNEHIIVLNFNQFDDEAADIVAGYFPLLEAELVKPHREHMYSFITIIALCGGAYARAKKLARRIRYSKNYKLSLYGYCVGRLAVADLRSGEVFTNAAGKPLRKFIEKKINSIKSQS